MSSTLIIVASQTSIYLSRGSKTARTLILSFTSSSRSSSPAPRAATGAVLTIHWTLEFGGDDYNSLEEQDDGDLQASEILLPRLKDSNVV